MPNEGGDYCPFGLTFNSYRRENSTPNQYLYNGKEKQDELALDWLDYGARMYMSEIGRWGVVDPLSESSISSSSFSYANNNPVRYIDLFGLSAFAFDEVSTNEVFNNGKGRDPSKYEEAKKVRERFSPTVIATCTTCPSDEKHDQYRSASHDFYYDNESGIVHNDIGTTVMAYSLADGPWIRNTQINKLSKMSEGLNNGSDMADLSVGLAQVGVVDFLSPHKVGSFSNLRRGYDLLTKARGASGALGAATTFSSLYFDHRSATLPEGDPNNISWTRFGWRTVGNFGSLGAGLYIGAQFGGPWGAAGGGSVGGFFYIGESIYDAVKWFGGELSKGAANFKNSGGGFLRR